MQGATPEGARALSSHPRLNRLRPRGGAQETPLFLTRLSGLESSKACEYFLVGEIILTRVENGCKLH